MLAKIGSAFSVLVIFTLLLFVVQNLSSVEIHFLVWTMDGSLAVPVIAAYLIGGISARPLWRLFRGQRKAHKVKVKAEKAAEKKLHEAVKKPEEGKKAPEAKPS
jgi:uncharacterized integral membrane protein